MIFSETGRRTVRCLVVFLLPFLLSSCAWLPNREYTVEMKDSGSTLHLHPGDQFTILLEGNPTTGYLWRIAAPYDENVIILRGDRYISPSTELCGAPGQRNLTFVAESSGRTGLKLVYDRPWEKNQPPEKEFHLMVLVHGDGDEKVQEDKRMRRNSKGELVPDRKRSLME